MPSELVHLLLESLTLQEASFVLVQTDHGYRLAWMLFLAGATSRALGEAGILMINRASKAQYVRSLLGSAAALTFSALVWAGCVWLALTFLFRHQSDYLDVQGLILVSYTPLIFSFITIVPHLGLLWNGLLKIWMLLVTIAGLNSQFELTVMQAIVCASLGWLLFYLLTALFGSRAEQVRVRLLGRQDWLRPKEAAVALLEREMKG